MKSKILSSVLLILSLMTAAKATTFTVNSTADGADADLADNICQTATAGECTLRAAIEQANQTAAPDTIAFLVTPPDGTVKTIAPASALPSITQPLTIDGYTQPGASANTSFTTDNAVILIELNGANAGANANGLTLVAGDTQIKGLAINRFSRVGISLAGADDCNISGNFIGTDATGLIDLGNASVGIYGEFASLSNANVIGGSAPSDRNIVAGNGNAGILFEFQAVNNVVLGNFVGLAADGATALGNDGYGIGFGSFTGGTIIGGDDAADGAADGIVGARNYISGNAGSGIFLGSGITVQGNYIGTDATGTLARPNNGGIVANVAGGSIFGGATNGAGNLISGNAGSGISLGNTGNVVIKGNLIGTKAGGALALGNTGDGIEIATGGSGNQIGGSGAGDGNIIAYNTQDGIQISDVGAAPTGNPISGNSIFSNGGLGINLSIDAVTPNDAGDADTGANRLQNYPLIVSAQPVAGGTRLTGTFSGAGGATLRLEFFNSAAVDPSGSGEGQTFLGAILVTTDAGGTAAFDQTFAYAAPPGSFVSATATDTLTNDTSEFSAARQVLNPTAARVAVGGRVLTAAGIGVFSARIVLTDANGNARYATTNPFGFYRFADIPAGATYVLTVRHKRFEFAAQILSVSEDRFDVNFVAPEQRNGFESEFLWR